MTNAFNNPYGNIKNAWGLHCQLSDSELDDLQEYGAAQYSHVHFTGGKVIDENSVSRNTVEVFQKWVDDTNPDFNGNIHLCISTNERSVDDAVDVRVIDVLFLGSDTSGHQIWGVMTDLY